MPLVLRHQHLLRELVTTVGWWNGIRTVATAGACSALSANSPFRYVTARALTLRDDNRGSEVNPITV